eukprot:s338_g2.t1
MDRARGHVKSVADSRGLSGAAGSVEGVAKAGQALNKTRTFSPQPLPSLAVHPFSGRCLEGAPCGHTIFTYMTELEFNRTFFNVPDPRAPTKQRARSLPAERGELESAAEAHRGEGGGGGQCQLEKCPPQL